MCIIFYQCSNFPGVVDATVANHEMGHLRKNGALLKQEEYFRWFKMLGMGTIDLGMCHKKNQNFRDFIYNAINIFLQRLPI